MVSLQQPHEQKIDNKKWRLIRTNNSQSKSKKLLQKFVNMNQIRNIGLRYSSTTSKIRKLDYDNLKSDTSSIISHDKTNMVCM